VAEQAVATGAHVRVPRVRRRSRRYTWPLVVGIGIFCLSAVLPLLFMAATAFRTEADWANSRIGLPTVFSFGAFRRAWTDANIDVYFRNSAIVTASTVALTVVSATLAAYSFSKLRWRLSGAVYLFVLVWIAIPPLLLMVPIYIEMVRLGLLNTYASVILLYTALNLPFNVYLMTAYFRSVPDELIEAARMDGAGVHRIFQAIMLPLAKPALATLIIFNVLWAWNEFLFALLLLQTDNVKTLTVGVLQLQGRFVTDYPAMMAGLLITSLPVIAAYLIFQRHLVRGLVAGAVK
jgi:raffinose/stachyose/melibiose transport system permease protein